MISISCPSRGRPELAKRMIDTAYDTAAGDIEFLIYLNDDDPTLQEYKDTIDKKHYTVGPNRSTCYSWNLMAEKAKFDYVFLAGDDIQFKTQHWDKIMTDGFNDYPDKILITIEESKIVGILLKLVILTTLSLMVCPYGMWLLVVVM